MPRGARPVGSGAGGDADYLYQGLETAEPGRAVGRRASRKPRVNYLQLLDGILEQNADPNTSSQRRPAKRREQGEEAQPREPKDGAAEAAARGGKRKATLVQQLEPEPAMPSSEAEDEGEEPGENVLGPDSDSDGAGEPAAARPRRQKKRQRVLVDVHGATGPGPQDPDECENEYERAVRLAPCLPALLAMTTVQCQGWPTLLPHRLCICAFVHTRVWLHSFIGFG
jgi:hypothetical protein